MTPVQCLKTTLVSCIVFPFLPQLPWGTFNTHYRRAVWMNHLGSLVPITLCCGQSLSCIQLFATPWTSACQASLSFTISLSLLKPMSIYSAMPSNHLILSRPLLLLLSIFLSIRVFSNESPLLIR